MDVAVITSGLSGLPAGAYLAQAGHQVTLYEQYHRAGGMAAPYERDGHTWDLRQLIIEGLAPDEPLGAILADFFTAPWDFPGLGVFALNAEASFDKRIPRELDRDTVQLYHYSILGGISKIADALVDKIESHGGRVYTGQPTARIEVEQGRATGVVEAGGRLVSADAVIASGGAKETFFKLVGEEHLAPEFVENVRGIPQMDSIFMVHLGADLDPSPYVHGVCTYGYGTYDIDQPLGDVRVGSITRAETGLRSISPACIRQRWRRRGTTP